MNNDVEDQGKSSNNQSWTKSRLSTSMSECWENELYSTWESNVFHFRSTQPFIVNEMETCQIQYTRLYIQYKVSISKPPKQTSTENLHKSTIFHPLFLKLSKTLCPTPHFLLLHLHHIIKSTTFSLPIRRLKRAIYSQILGL